MPLAGTFPIDLPEFVSRKPTPSPSAVAKRLPSGRKASLLPEIGWPFFHGISCNPSPVAVVTSVIFGSHSAATAIFFPSREIAM